MRNNDWRDKDALLNALETVSSGTRRRNSRGGKNSSFPNTRCVGKFKLKLCRESERSNSCGQMPTYEELKRLCAKEEGRTKGTHKSTARPSTASYFRTDEAGVRCKFWVQSCPFGVCVDLVFIFLG